MQHPVPSDIETRSNASFDALMWALSRPGQIRRLPTSGFAGIVETLIDRECRVVADQEDIVAQLERTGAELVEPERADHVFVGETFDVSLLPRLSQGSDLYPEGGATLVTKAHFSEGPRLRLTGPGVDGAKDVQIGGLPDAFWSRRRAVMRYPMGFDVFFIDDDRVMGLPRTTAVEVL